MEKEWKKYPILYLDLNTGDYRTKEGLEAVLNSHLVEWEKEYGADESGDTLSLRFKGIVERACKKTGLPVVILVDEYDKPLIYTLDNEELNEAHRMTMKAFYSVLKTNDAYIKFAFLTGVTRFSGVSIFSDLNNLNDISMDEQYADICGLTEQEIRDNFDFRIAELADNKAVTKEECYEMLKKQYDGYHFAKDSVGVYNPFSMVKTLAKLEMDDYWIATGTPTILAYALKNYHYDLTDIFSKPVSKSDLQDIVKIDKDPMPLFYQSGYLTIKDYDKEMDLYTLDFPNMEVRKGFLEFLIPSFVPVRTSGAGIFFVGNFREAVLAGEPEDFMERMQNLFDNGDYEIEGKMEKYYHNAVALLFMLLGMYVKTSAHTARGRMDCTVETDKFIYLFEFKLDKTAEEALSQIDERGYADKYKLDPRKLYKIGVNFSSEKKTIDKYLIKVADEGVE